MRMRVITYSVIWTTSKGNLWHTLGPFPDVDTALKYIDELYDDDQERPDYDETKRDNVYATGKVQCGNTFQIVQNRFP